MLRVLMLSMALGFVAFAPTAWSQSAPAPDAAELDQAQQRARDAVRQALGSQPDADEIQRVTRASPPNAKPPLRLPSSIEDPAGSLSLQSEPRPWNAGSEPRLLIMVSFSMPDTALRSLAHEARRIGAPMVLRGLVKDSFPETLAAIRSLAGEASDMSGVSIDPTLFTRFAVQSVPTYVLLLEPLRTCTSRECAVPNHLRLSGESGLRHVLETMGRGADPEVRAIVDPLAARLDAAP
ncbi:MAG: type-F conjugative transfer system pilin assembly protein TrbC [Pseudomonadota bacterium]|nr:type-F conjugative transfer system pilin assembly protein TrbC [Pseudomonadota bacterium]